MKILLVTCCFFGDVILPIDLLRLLQPQFPGLEIESMSGDDFDIQKIVSDWDWCILDINSGNSRYPMLTDAIRCLPTEKKLHCLGFRWAKSGGAEVFQYGLGCLSPTNNIAEKLAEIILADVILEMSG